MAIQSKWKAAKRGSRCSSARSRWKLCRVLEADQYINEVSVPHVLMCKQFFYLHIIRGCSNLFKSKEGIWLSDNSCNNHKIHPVIPDQHISFDLLLYTSALSCIYSFMWTDILACYVTHDMGKKRGKTFESETCKGFCVHCLEKTPQITPLPETSEDRLWTFGLKSYRSKLCYISGH